MSHIFMVPCISAELPSTLTTAAGHLSECTNRKLRSIPKKKKDPNGMLHVTSFNVHSASDCVQKKGP